MTKTVENKFKRLKKLERQPLIKVETNKPIFVKILSDFRAGIVKKKQAVFLSVQDLNTGEIGDILVSAVLHSTLNETYPQAGFVEKSFEIIRREKKTSESSGNGYNTFEVYELMA